MNRIYNNDNFIPKTLNITQKDGYFYLNAEYLVDSKYHFGTLTIKDILLPVHCCPTIKIHQGSFIHPNASVDLGFGELQVDSENINYQVTKHKPQTLTLAEIEDKLGYKINLVSEKEKK